MDKKTRLTKSNPEFLEQWRQYKKGLKGLGKTDWCISSDYCFDDPNKLDVATFTIFPKVYIKQIVQGINANLPNDIKDMREVSEKAVNFLKSKYFFSISIVIENLKCFFNEEMAIKQVSATMRGLDTHSLKMSEPDVKECYRRLNELNEYLKKKSHSKRLLSQLYFVAQYASKIIEFLLIKENARVPHWCSDRDRITSFGDGVIFYLLQMYTEKYLRNRIAEFKISLPFGINDTDKGFDFDPLIRIPDIITGVMSSQKMTDKGLMLQKKKHYELFGDVIVDNPRIVLINTFFDIDGKEHSHNVYWKQS